MKTRFELVDGFDLKTGIRVNIVGKKPDNKPYLSIQIPLQNEAYFIADKQLEKFAVNILKALKSKKLKP